MNLKKHAATIVTTGGALVAWFAGTTTNHTVAPPRVVEQPAIDVRGAELATEVAKLHERLQPSTRPQSPARNLFRFREARARVAAPVVTPQPAAVALPPAAPPILPMKLVGMAEDPGPDGPIRIAFINVEGQLFGVKDGETILQKYLVTKISADVVELTDANDGTVRRLALR